MISLSSPRSSSLLVPLPNCVPSIMEKVPTCQPPSERLQEVWDEGRERGEEGQRGGERGGEARKHGTHTEAEKEDNQRGLRVVELLSLLPPLPLPLTFPTGVLLYCWTTRARLVHEWHRGRAKVSQFTITVLPYKSLLETKIRVIVSSLKVSLGPLRDCVRNEETVARISNTNRYCRVFIVEHVWAREEGEGCWHSLYHHYRTPISIDCPTVGRCRDTVSWREPEETAMFGTIWTLFYM